MENNIKDYSMNNAAPVLERLNGYISLNKSFKIEDIYDELSIFDWWPETLTRKRMKQMRSFLRLAIKLGFTGYVCFKVGASGCANGMWACKDESTDGYSPDGDCLYRSFSPDYTYYNAKINEEWLAEKVTGKYNGLETKEQLTKALLGEVTNG